jgi:hypothetical protein
MTSNRCVQDLSGCAGQTIKRLLHTFNIRLAIAHSPPRQVLQSRFRHRALPGVYIASAFAHLLR